MAGGKPSPDDVAALHAQVTAELAAGRLVLKPFYWDLRNEIVRPWETVSTTRYFWSKWRPKLGASYTGLVVDLRLLMTDASSQRDGRGVVVSHEELAARSGMSVRSVERLLGPTAYTPENWFLPLFVRPFQRYDYDPKSRKRVRQTNGYEVALDDPLLPEDEELLRGKYTEEEVRALIRQGVVDFQQYVALRRSGPNRQVGGDGPDLTAKHGDPIAPPWRAGAPDRQVGGKVQVPDINGAIRDPSPNRQLVVADSSSSSRDLFSTAAERPSATPLDDVLVDAVVHAFKGLSRNKAERLITDCSAEVVRDQLAWFPHRDNSWATKGPLAAFIHYCRDRAPKPEAVEEDERRKEAEARRRVDAAALRDRMEAQRRDSFEAREARQARSPYAELWRKLDVLLAMALPSEHVFDLWYAPLELVEVTHGQVTWTAPNDFHRSFAETHCGEVLQAVVTQLLGEVTVRLVAAGEPVQTSALASARAVQRQKGREGP